MKPQTPLTPELAYQEAKQILALSGHKLFTPPWLYFKLDHGLIGVRPFKRSAFYLALHKNIVIISETHLSYNDPAVLKEIREKFQPFVLYKPRQLRRFRGERWDDLPATITPSEREEFKILIKGTRLQAAG